MSSTGSSEGNEAKIIEHACENLLENENQRFSLRKRRNINYDVKTKKFEYEEDSDYEGDRPKKKGGKKK